MHAHAPHILLALSLRCLPLALASTPPLPYFLPLNTTTTHPSPFNISVSREVIDEAASKARLYRPSVDLQDDSNSGWLEGPPGAEMISLASHWAANYSWSRVEHELNTNFSHYALTVSARPAYNRSLPLHFVHRRSTNSSAIPLLLLHGWPSTFLEWSSVIAPLSANFHVVAPDLPGFGFSPAPVVSGLDPAAMGIALDNLMAALNYSSYGVVSTDLGWWVGLWMCSPSVVAPGRILGHFTDFWLQQPTADDLDRFSRNETDADEDAYIAAVTAWNAGHTGYSQVHTQSPLAVGQALTDSPVGFAGWVWHLVHAISDGRVYSYDEVITRALMLWIQGTWGGLRTYREFFSAEAMNFPTTTVPTGVTEWENAKGPFPDLVNMQRAPRSWIERFVKLVYFKRHDRGGHFPAENLPDLWVQDVEEFFGSL